MKIDTKKPLYVAGFSVVTSVVFTLAIMVVQVATKGAVERNQRLLEQKALVDILRLGDIRAMTPEQISSTFDTRTQRRKVRDPQTGREVEIVVAHEGAAGQSKVTGYAVPVQGIGFWELISGYLGVTADLKKVTGIAILRQAETPGLGGEITQEHWRRRWEGLSIDRPARDDKYVYVGGSKPESPQDPRQGRHVEAITGATGTSVAVERFVNEDLAVFRRAAEAAGLAGGAQEGRPN